MSKTKAKANWLDPNTTAENEVLPRYLKWAWASRGLSLAISAVLIGMLTYYCTDMLGLPATVVGTILLVSKLFDGVTDLVAGYIIDRTNTRFGKARPYEIFIIFVWLLVVVLYSAPKMGMTQTVIFVFILYTMINSICVTFLSGEETVYLSRAIRGENNRVSVASFTGGIVMIGAVVFSIIMPQLIAGIGTTKAGWTVIALSLAVPFSIIGMLRFIFVKEVVTEAENRSEIKKAEPLGLKTSLKAIAQNKYAFMLAGMSLSVNLIYNIGTAVETYYFKYIMGDIGLGSVASMCGFATPLVLLVFPALSRKFGTAKLLRAGAIMVVIGYALRILGGTFMGTFIAGTFFKTIGVLPLTMMGSIYLIDCMDYGEWKTGVRVDGMLNSINGFCAKLGSGVASGMVGFIMGIAGYNGSLAVQSATANTAIITITNWVPLILAIVLVVLGIAYKLDKELPGIKAELAERKKVH